MSDIGKLHKNAVKALNELTQAITVTNALTIRNLIEMEGQVITKNTPYEATGMSKIQYANAKKRYLNSKK